MVQRLCRIGAAEDRQLGILFRDILPRKRVEAAMRRSEERARALINASSDVVYRMSADWKAMRQLTGKGVLTDVEGPTIHWEEFVHPEGLPRFRAAIATAIAEHAPFELEHRVRRADGSEGWSFCRAVPVFEAGGSIAEWFGMATDVTERVLAEDRQQMLNAELDHRMKNLFAMVQAMSAQTLRGVEDRGRVDALLERLRALSRAHDILVRRSWTSALVSDVAAAFAEALGGADRIRLAGPEVKIGSRSVLSLALLLHEFGTNAVKHGALSAPSGGVDLTWQVEGADATFRLVWREWGGPPAVSPTRKGFGSKLISTGLLGAGAVRLDYAASGLTVDVSAPLTLLTDRG